MRTVIAAAMTVALLAQLPSETAGWDNVVASLLSVVDRADVLALGEAHGRKVDAAYARSISRPSQGSCR